MAMLTLADADKWMKSHGYDNNIKPQEDTAQPQDEELDYRKIPYLGQFVGHTADATTQGVADIFQAIGLEQAGNYLNDKVKESSARLPEMRKPELSLDYVTDPNGMTSAFAQVVGSMLPMAAAARFVPSSLGAVAGNAASRVPLVGGLLGKYLPGAVQWSLGSTPVEALMEKGGTERDLLEQGYSREEAQSKSNDVFLKNLALLTATNTLEGLLGGRILKGVSGELGGSMLGRLGTFGLSAAGENALNAFEEGEQTGFQDSAMGKYASLNPLNWSDSQVEAAEMGLAGMIPMTLLGLPAAMRSNRRNNSTEAESNDDNNPPPSAPSDGTDVNAKAVYDRFKQAGYSDEAIAGIMGRVQQEHNFNTSNVEEYDDPETGLHLGGYGMFQWNGGRTTRFLEWAKENGRDPQDPVTQADFAIIEAEERGLTPEVMNQMNHIDAATTWTDKWEVGEHGNEHEYASEWLERIKSGDLGGTPSAARSAVPRFNASTASDEDFTSFLEWGKDAPPGETPEAIARNQNLFEAAWTEAGKTGVTPQMREEVAATMSPADWEAYDNYRASKMPQAEQAKQTAPMNRAAQPTPQIQTQANNLAPVQVPELKGQAALTGPNSAGQGVQQQVRAQNAALQEGQQKAQTQQAVVQQAQQVAQAVQQAVGGMQNANQIQPTAAEGASAQGVETGGYQNQNAQPKQSAGARTAASQNQVEGRPTKQEMDLAADEILVADPQNFGKGYRSVRDFYKQQADAILQPALNTLQSGMQQGVDLVPWTDGSGRQSRSSNNAPWYRDFYKKNGRKPTKTELREMAKQLVTGDSSAPDVEGWTPRTAEEAQAMQEQAARLAEIERKIAALDAVKEKVAKGKKKKSTAKKSNKKVRDKSAQKSETKQNPAAQEAAQQEKKTERKETIAEENKPAQNGSEEARMYSANGTNETGGKSAKNKKAVSVEENIANGEKAMRKVIAKHTNVRNAMYREDVGNIDLVWGTPGTGSDFKHGYGVSHIIAKRDAENGRGKETAYKLVEVIAKGDVSGNNTMGNTSDPRMFISFDGYTALLVLSDGKKNTWLLSGWENYDSMNKKEESSANGEGYGSTAATSDAPMRSRHAGDDSSSSVPSVAQKQEESKQKKETVIQKATRIASSSHAMKNVASQFGATEKDGKPVFKTDKQAKAFLKAAQAIKNDEQNQAQTSASEENERLQELLATREWLSENKLTKQHKAIADFGMEMGVPVVFFKADPDLHGYHVGGVTFLNVNSAMNLEQTFWHETFHWMKNNNPKLYKDLVRHISKLEKFSDKQLEAYRESIGRPELTDAETIEEMMADAMMNAKDRVSFMKDLAKTDKTLAERLIAWLRDIMDKFQAYMNNPDAGLTNTQKEAMSNWLERHARAMVDENGQPIFRITPNKEILLADGTPLPAVAYSFAGEQSKTADTKKLYQAFGMAASGKSPQEIFKATGWLKGKDGKWRYEIPDLLSKINFANVKKRGVAMLEKAYDNPKLYEAYPFLKKIRIEAAEMDADTYGQAMKRTIQINKDMLDDAESKKTLVHEIQHMIQDREGFAAGGASDDIREQLGNKADSSLSDYDIYYRLAGEQEAREVERRAENQKTYEEAQKKLADAEKAYAEAKKGGNAEEIRKAKTQFDKAKAVEGIARTQAEALPTVHNADAIVIFDGQEIPIAARYSIGKSDKKQDKSTNAKGGKSVDNVGLAQYNKNNKPKHIADTVVQYPNGGIDVVRLINPIQKNESREDRIARRKKEMHDISLGARRGAGLRGVFINALSAKHKETIDKKIANGESRDKLKQKYLVLYNKYLSNYSERMSEHSEKKTIAAMIFLKGAEYYAGETEQRADTRGNDGNSVGRSDARGNDKTLGGRGRTKFSANLKRDNEGRSNKSGFSNAVEKQMDAVRKQYEGTKKWMKAPNGEDTNLNERQWLAVRTPNFKEWAGDWENDPANATKVLDENGEPLVVHHGTVGGEFYIFNRDFASVEGDMGAGFYFTNSSDDVSRNYEGGGPDFENKVARRAERIQSDEDISYEEAEKRAREELFTEANLFDVFLDMKYPAEVKNTLLFTDEDIDSEITDDIDEDDTEAWDEARESALEDLASRIIDRVDAEGYDVKQEDLGSLVFDAFFDGGINIPALQEKLNDLYIEDSEGNLAGNEVMRLIIDELGYDGIIDSTVSKKFKNMNLSPDTTHYIVFNPTQIKSATDNVGTYDRANPDIRYSVKAGIEKANKLDADNMDRAKVNAIKKLDPKAEKKAEREAQKAAKKAEAIAKKREEDKAAGRLIENGKTEIQRPESKGSLGLKDLIIGSPSRIAERYPAFKPFFNLADKAMKKLTMLRETWGKDLSDALTLAGDDKGRETLYSILWEGDAQGKEFTDAELKEQGASQEVIDAYHSVRSLMDKIYTALDDARRRPKTHTQEVSKEKLAEMKSLPQFYDILREEKGEGGNVKVTYREFANWEKVRTVDKAAYDLMKKDPAIQILKTKKNKDGTYTLKTRETIPHITKRGGYIPHFFHNFMVRVVDKDGKASEAHGISGMIGSGRTEAEAIKIAKEYEKNLQDGEKLIVSPKTFNFKALGMDEKMLAVILGDKDYNRMMQNLQKFGDMTLEEAEQFARKKGKSRFNAQFLHRKGAEGFEKSMEWVLRHHVNTSARYVAMQDFKPNALSLFERMYGDFSKTHSGLADFTKDYINDVNGVPSNLEKTINNTLMNWDFYRKHVASHFGERAALQLAGDISGAVSIAKLGFFNASSALLNLTQIANAAAYIGDVNVLWNGIRRGMHGNHDKRIIYENGKEKVTEQQVLDDTGVQYDIGLDSGGGYDKFRPGELAGKSMAFFKASESAVRRGTVLAAYKKAREQGKNHEQAIEFANEVNRKSNFEYGVHDAPNAFRRGSIIAQLLGQFKKYPIKQLEVMADMLPYFSDKTSAKQKAIFWGTYFMLAGLFQWPFGEWFEELAEMLGIKPGPTVRKWIMAAAGDDPNKQALAKIALYGVPSLAGVDISQRYGLGGVLPSEMYLGKNPTYLKAALSLMGASTDTAKNVISALNAALHGDKDEALANLRGISPGIANMVEAATGVRYDRRGRVATRYDSAYDKILKAIGFRSTKEAVTTDLRNIYYDAKDEQKGEKQKAIDRYLDDPTTENAKRLRELNVKPDTVKKARQQRKLDNLSRTEANMTKQERKDFKDLMKFSK